MNSIDRSQAIRKVYQYFNQKGYDFKSKTFLDVFARDGRWQSSFLASKVLRTEAWEVDAEFEKELTLNLPSNSQVKICNSIETIKKTKDKFDIIVFDNPMACYGPNNMYSEHFDIIRNFHLVSKETALVIFNVKTKPYNYEDNLLWQQRRNSFYGVDDASELKLDYLKRFYKNLFKVLNYKTVDDLIEPRPQERDLYQFAYNLEKICQA
jgi:hypothetical protein